jgi:hypothetical protein
VVVGTEAAGDEDVEIAVVVCGSETVGFAIWHAEVKTAIAAAIRPIRCGDREVMAPCSRDMTLSMVDGDSPAGRSSARVQDRAATAAFLAAIAIRSHTGANGGA